MWRAWAAARASAIAAAISAALRHVGRSRREPLAERLPLEELGDGVGDVSLAADVVDGEDVRVGERGERPRLALEPRDPVGVARDGLGEDLDGDLAAETGVAGAVDLSHPAGAEWAEDLVRTEPRAPVEHVGVRSFPDRPGTMSLLEGGLRQRNSAPRVAGVGRLPVPESGRMSSRSTSPASPTPSPGLPARADEDVPATRKAAVAAVLRDGGRRRRAPLHPPRRAPAATRGRGRWGFPAAASTPATPPRSPRRSARRARRSASTSRRSAGRSAACRRCGRTCPLGSVPHSVVPFAFAIEGDPELRLNEEVQEALWVPLSFLLDRGNRSAFTWVRKGLPLPMPCYTFRAASSGA